MILDAFFTAKSFSFEDCHLMKLSEVGAKVTFMPRSAEFIHFQIQKSFVKYWWVHQSPKSRSRNV